MIQPMPKSRNQPVPKSNPPFIIPTLPGHIAPPAAPFLTMVPTHGSIAQRAYDIYVHNGYQQGQCQQDWQQAEKDLHDQGPVACQAEHLRMDVFAPDSISAQ